MTGKKIILPVSFFLLLFFSACSSEVNSPGDPSMEDIELFKFQTIEGDLNMLERGGMHLPDVDAVFSIGWNEIFRPLNDNSQIKGMAFAVAFDDEPTNNPVFPGFGIDMGTVDITYSGNQVELHKLFHPMRGTAYSLFNRPFGGSETLLEFIPNAEYTFNISGSDNFPQLELTLLSPPSLMDITSHSQGDLINPEEDLNLEWTGGNSEEKIAIRMLVHMQPRPGGPPVGVIGGKRGDRHHAPPPFIRHKLIALLDNNPGNYTIPAEQLQQLISQTNSDKLVLEISQVNPSESEHDGRIIHTVMRNGSSVLLALP